MPVHLVAKRVIVPMDEKYRVVPQTRCVRQISLTEVVGKVGR